MPIYFALLAVANIAGLGALLVIESLCGWRGKKQLGAA
jgi:hypothetical protein